MIYVIKFICPIYTHFIFCFSGGSRLVCFRTCNTLTCRDMFPEYGHVIDVYVRKWVSEPEVYTVDRMLLALLGYDHLPNHGDDDQDIIEYKKKYQHYQVS